MMMLLIHIASHPTRFAILNILIDGGRKNYASPIGQKLKIERKTVAFHLNTLEKYKLVKSEYGLNYDDGRPPTAVRYYEITPKGKEIFEKIKSVII